MPEEGGGEEPYQLHREQTPVLHTFVHNNHRDNRDMKA